jgi:uncharacterized protein (DUF2235 family)
MSYWQITKQYQLRESKAPKNIIVLIDGTWNDESGAAGDGLTTNVVKLYKSLAKIPGKQDTWYFRGVGNDDEYGFWGRIWGGMVGAKEREIRNHAYAMIAKTYAPGDRIFIFGFSRGAAIARLLAGMIQEIGIPETLSLTTVAKENKGTRNPENRYLDHSPKDPHKEGVPTREVAIEFLGVWDTVVAMGVRGMFKNFSVASNVKKAVHLLALDETRNLFKPTLMNWDPGRVEEIWMPGVHSDVGGSYAEDELAKLSLHCMVSKLKAHATQAGVEIHFNDLELSRYVREEVEMGIFHFHGLGFMKGIRKVQRLHQNEFSHDPAHQPTIHKSVFDLQKSQKVFSLVELKLEEGKKVRPVPIIYNPPNVKVLNKRYEVDET